MEIDWEKLIISIFVCGLAGAIGAIFTSPKVNTWYANLIKPDFMPPTEVFAPVWIVLYLTMAIALYLIWTNKKKNKDHAYFLFGVQLFLNALWSVLFFGFNLFLCSLICILSLIIALIFTIVKFWKINKNAGAILIPYLLWIIFATILTYYMWLLN